MKKDAKPELTQAACVQLCPYYKPGRNEELACQGYLVLERLALKGVLIGRSKAEHPRDRAGEEHLVRALCMACSFHAQDCDFMENSELPPCGGFLLLAQLLAAKDISMEDVK